ncbi:Zinc-binding dehydrogenase-like protein 14 [Elsinoe fawcettii]|nr:Zinc-binding dehydrogenase-like protein 14 [Elsinoe fawcettii]
MQAIHIRAFLTQSESFSFLTPSTVPRPAPKPNEILVRVTHVSIQQVDLLYARGRHQNNNPKRGHVHPPFILGLDFVGVVASTNSKSTFKPGDRVFGSSSSAFGEYLSLPTTSLQPIPSSISSRDACALVSGVVSHVAVQRLASVRSGQVVLVTGVPGNLALIACQCAQSAGATVIALARNESRAALIRPALPGVTVLASNDNWQAEVKKLTSGKGVDSIIDNVGTVKDGLSVLAFGGSIVLVGFAGRGGVMESVTMNRILLKGAKVIGYRFGEGARQGLYNPAECWREYLDAISTGQVSAVVDSRQYIGLTDVGRAMDDLDKGRLMGKAVVDITATSSRL